MNLFKNIFKAPQIVICHIISVCEVGATFALFIILCIMHNASLMFQQLIIVKQTISFCKIKEIYQLQL